ncbi:hypothetical protein TanjilG_03541 [Lupinus angustifolius]|uniref:Uncharacterized protein n=1 Tax=Lupinus angustifolius TaxID=3871 RepID=A0A394DP61_LUPAN|nr:hypothetical protein TanjilG_03541 [Lupinus angustifolius]
MAVSVSSKDNRSELVELKVQMNEMFNMLKALQSEKGKNTQTTNVGPLSNPTQLPKGKFGQEASARQQKEEATKWHFYGMPPDYVSLYEEELNEPHGQSNAHLEQPTP